MNALLAAGTSRFKKRWVWGGVIYNVSVIVEMLGVFERHYLVEYDTTRSIMKSLSSFALLFVLLGSTSNTPFAYCFSTAALPSNTCTCARYRSYYGRESYSIPRMKVVDARFLQLKTNRELGQQQQQYYAPSKWSTAAVVSLVPLCESTWILGYMHVEEGSDTGGVVAVCASLLCHHL